MLSEIAADATNQHIAAASQSTSGDVTPTKKVKKSSKSQNKPSKASKRPAASGASSSKATSRTPVSKAEKNKHRKAFELDPLLKQYSAMGVKRVKASTYFIDVVKGSNNKVQYLYIIVSTRFRVVKIGVTSLSKQKLLLRYQSALGQIDKIQLYKIRNGKQLHLKFKYAFICLTNTVYLL